MTQNEVEAGGVTLDKTEAGTTVSSDEVDEHKLLSMLDPDPVKAAERLKTIRRKLITFFARKGCRRADTEDLASDTILRCMQKIDYVATINVSIEAYLYGIAKHVWQEYLRKPPGLGPLDDIREPVDGSDPLQELLQAESDEQYRKCVKRCRQVLTQEERDLYDRYFKDWENHADRIRERAQLAAQLCGSSKSPSEALTLRAGRVRKKLEDCVKECLGKK